MERRPMGSLDVSVVGLGCNNFGGRLDQAQTTRVVHAAIDAGINFFDTADVYGGTHSEEFLGRALEGRRSSVIIATKFGLAIDEERTGGARPEYIVRAVTDSLKRLGTDYIDLYQLHRPDPQVPIAETLGALAELARQGKVREIGCSNFSVEQLQRAARATRPSAARFISLQNEYSLLERDVEHGVLDECVKLGMAFLPYFPLASGLLTGKYQSGQPLPPGARLSAPGSPLRSRFWSERNLLRADALRGFAEARGHHLLELAFSWLAARPAVASVIAGATTPEQVRANAAAVNFALSSEDLAEVDALAPLDPPAQEAH